MSTGSLNEPRPHFAGKIENVTVNVGREATLECPVNHLGRYKVSKNMDCLIQCMCINH